MDIEIGLKLEVLCYIIFGLVIVNYVRLFDCFSPCGTKRTLSKQKIHEYYSVISNQTRAENYEKCIKNERIKETRNF